MVQFRTLNGLCRRCRQALDREDLPIIEIGLEPQAVVVSPPPLLQVAKAIRRLRERAGLSQRQLALRMGVPRTYISKIEKERAKPTLLSLRRMARALRVTVAELLNSAQNEAALSELLADDFIAELAPYLSKLNPLQWQSVLAQMRDMTLHTRRSA